MHFLSSDNVLKHKEFLNNLKLKYSVLEKSFPFIKGKNIKDISRMRIGESDKNEIISLLGNIALHELYFNSFSKDFYPSEVVRQAYGSEANFLYEMECEILKNEPRGFMLVYFDKRRRPAFRHCVSFAESLLSFEPILAIDLCEHAYFMDYGFDRKRYVKCALSHLNLNKINDFCKTY